MLIGVVPGVDTIPYRHAWQHYVYTHEVVSQCITAWLVEITTKTAVGGYIVVDVAQVRACVVHACDGT